MTRKRIQTSTLSEVLVECRRRCCVCFGLHRDADIKKGQVAHLDHDPANNSRENLAFLCLNHHDEYDSNTSQSKKLTMAEVVAFRLELAEHFGPWSLGAGREQLLNFLAFTADEDALAAAAVKAAGSAVFYGRDLALQVLETDEFSSIDSDLYGPYLQTLDYYASWGLLSFATSERDEESELPTVEIKVTRKPICDRLATKIRSAALER